MALSDWTERTRLLVTGAVAAALNLAVWGFVYHAHFVVYQKRYKDKTALTKVVNQQEEDKRKLEELKLKVQKYEEENQRRIRKIPEGTPQLVYDYVTWLTGAEAQPNIMAERGNLSLERNKPSDIPDIGPDFKRDIIRVSYSADFEGLLALINRVEEPEETGPEAAGKGVRFAAIEGLSIQAAASGMGVNLSEGKPAFKHNATFDIITWRREPGNP
jgi:hypothetical protein